MRTFLFAVAILSLAVVVRPVSAGAESTPTFTLVPLVRPEGDTEPAISIGSDGTTAVTGLNIASGVQNFFTNSWIGSFGSDLPYNGPLDAFVGRAVGGNDADVDIGSTGTLHATTLGIRFNSNLSQAQLVVTSVTCPGPVEANGSEGCTKQIIDNAGTDRPWVTLDGTHVYISYHDSGSGAIRVQRSDDDGYTWKKIANVIVGQGTYTGNATFNNGLGPIVADPSTHMVFQSYTGGPKQGKGQNLTHNMFFVARSSDLGTSWKTTRVYVGPVDTSFDQPFPNGLAVDPISGALYASFGDGTHIFFTRSLDHGLTWSKIKTINSGGAATALFPELAAYDGKVDLAYYGTTASDRNDPDAHWNVFDAQSVDGGKSFQQLRVTPKSNHWGPICTDGDACPLGTRSLADLFEVAEDPRTGRAGIAYTSDTLGHPFTIDSGPTAGKYFAAEGRFTRSIVTLPGGEMAGPTTYVGTACSGESVPAPPTAAAVAVVARGPCLFAEKAQTLSQAGYSGFVLFERADDTDLVFGMEGSTVVNIPGVMVAHSTGLAIFGAATESDLSAGETGAPITVGGLRPQVVVAYENG